jgi:galactokinase
VTAIPLSFADHGYALAVVDTGGSHADLTDEYAAIPQEMRAVAAELGEEVLSDVAEGDFYRSLGGLRKNVGDRAVNRAIHFFEENKRVLAMTQAVRSGDIESYVRLMSDSGHSSGLYLQNCAPTGVSRDQAVVTALALAEKEMAGAGLRVGTDAACRVHGGGFAGTIQLLLPADRLDIVTEALSVYLGSEAVTNLSIRAVGTTALPLA